MSDTDPDSLIRDLDDALMDAGTMVKLRRVVGDQRIPFDVALPAFVVGYGADELVGGITQADRRFTISPTEIDRHGWPGYRTSARGREDDDARVPQKGDILLTPEGEFTVQKAKPWYVQGRLVRIEGQARGG